ncbi:MAG: pyridoxal-phosphate dependent enzyme [Rhodobacteraceae bacterium]|nr:pyridoxal-phosphate dependent enzyme [Paracoccaceae bacterium]
MQIIDNPWRGAGVALPDVPAPSTDAAAVATLLARCPMHAATPLVESPQLAARAGVARLWVKDERGRMGLGSFKALGAAYVVAHDAVATGAADLATALVGRTYVTASAGNHGLSVAAGARVFGARAVIYLAQTVPQAFAERLEAKGAEVVRAGADYEASMTAAARAADANGWTLLSDSSWPGYVERPHRLMEGYLQCVAEALEACTPTHVFVQAGVGGLAAAVAALVRARLGDGPSITIVEPQAAPALFESLAAGRFVTTQGPVSSMGRLDCKEASLIALKGLSRDADRAMLITEDEAARVLPLMEAAGLDGSESGCAGVAGLMALAGAGESPGPEARVLCFLTEGRA